MKPTTDGVFGTCQSAVNAYLMAKAYAMTMRERVDEVQRAILAECPLDTAPEFIERGRPDEKITDPKHTYLATEVHFRDYQDECNHRLRKLGIKPDDMPDEHCPALIAEHLQVQAEWLLLEYGWNAMGGEKGGWENLWGEDRKKFLDLLCKIVMNHPKYTTDQARGSRAKENA